MLKTAQKLICCTGLVIFAIFAFKLPVYAYDAVITAGYTLPNGTQYTINAQPKNINENTGKLAEYEYVLVLPCAVEGTEVVLNCAEKTYIDGAQVTGSDGIVLERGEHSLKYGERDYILRVVYTSDILQIYINVQGNGLPSVHADKNNKEPGTIFITDGETNWYSGEMEYIKGRGNVTWNKAKKPYNIKLSSKASIDGMEAAKKYTLIASYLDNTFIRNKIALDLADRMGIPYCSDSRMADLYIDGRYMGLYILFEKVEVSANSVDILDLEYLNMTVNAGTDLSECPQGGDYEGDASQMQGTSKWVEIPLDISKGLTGGYLLELEQYRRYPEEKCGFISNYGQPIILKNPEYASKNQVEYISGYYNEMEEALLDDDGYNSLGKHYSEYVDVDSVVKMLVFQEYVQNIDAASTSSFLCKDNKGKLTACCAWDMDKSLGGDFYRYGLALSRPDNIFIVGKDIFSYEGAKNFFSLFVRHTEFREKMVQYWNETGRAETEAALRQSVELSAHIYDSAVLNAYYWQSDIAQPIEQAEQAYLDAQARMETYIEERTAFMDGYMHPDAKYAEYRSNGANGAMVDSFSYMPGDIAVVLENEYTNDGKAFIGWNTQPDGSGTSYNSGDEITMTENVYLYAQWDGDNEEFQEQPQPQQQSIGFFARLINRIKRLFRE